MQHKRLCPYIQIMSVDAFALQRQSWEVAKRPNVPQSLSYRQFVFLQKDVLQPLTEGVLKETIIFDVLPSFSHKAIALHLFFNFFLL